MISRNMLIALQDREKFLKNALTPMSFFGVKTALLYVFRNPVEYNIEKGWEFPKYDLSGCASGWRTRRGI